MTQFHEGQDVEVRVIADGMNEMHWSWRKAKIICFKNVQYDKDCYLVQFPDGTRGVFEEAHIRKAKTTTISDHVHNFSRPEQNSSYRSAMHAAGRGRLLP